MLNSQKSGWSQFNVHYYDSIKKSKSEGKVYELGKLEEDILIRTPADILESMFLNQWQVSTKEVL